MFLGPSGNTDAALASAVIKLSLRKVFSDFQRKNINKQNQIESGSEKKRNLKYYQLYYFAVACEAGTFKNSTECCEPCPPNEVSIGGAPTCTKCPSGTTADKSRTICGNFLEGGGKDAEDFASWLH